MDREHGFGTKAAFPEPGFVGTAVKPWIRSAKQVSPVGSRRQLRFTGRGEVQMEHGALQEPDERADLQVSLAAKTFMGCAFPEWRFR